jgi:hypothetical protein
VAEFFDDAARLSRLISSLEPRFQRRFLEVVQSIRDARTLADLEALVLAGNIEEALVAAEVAALRLSNIWGDSFLLAGHETAAVIGNALEVIVNFDQINLRALDVITRNQLRLVREFAEEQRAATRLALQDGIERGLNPRDMARAFRDSIGLTAKQQQFVINYRTQLQQLDSRALQRALRDKRFDPALLRAIRDGKALTPEQIEKMVGRYQARWIKFRSEVIARSEALKSVHGGTWEMYQQAVDGGVLVEDELKRTWDTSDDGRERDWHHSMHRQTVGLNEPFTSGKGNQTLEGPGHFGIAEEDIQCRCAVATRFTDSAKAATPTLIPATSS